MKPITMKPNQILLIAGLSMSALLFTACDKEDILPNTPAGPSTGAPAPSTPQAPTPPPVTTSNVLKQFGTDIFKYDAQNRLVEVSYTFQADLGYTVVYEGNRPARLNFKNGEYLLYTYNNDKVEKAIVYFTDHQKKFDYTFAYNGDKLVKQTTITYLGPNWEKTSISDFKYDASGNLTEQVIKWWLSDQPDVMRGPSTIKWGNYDNKPNPLPYALSSLYLPGVKLHTNNPGFRDPGLNKELYTYTYHASGMPKDRTLKLEPYPEQPAYTETYNY
ncbi:hypothetical protein [Pontibacter sp. H249]|uniref:hypothetical protein n=1 Tax=Pontibacter sp. H249 TaxID=3133420 RepID=UPI0030C10A82